MTSRQRLALAAITIAALVLRMATLDLQSFWFDESVTIVDTLRGTLGETMNAVGEMEVTPHLYFVLAWVWAKLFGVGEVGLRSLSALLGTALVPVAYLIGARLMSIRGGLVLAALVAVNPLLFWYSQEARSYALLTLLGALSFLLFLRALEGPRTGRLAAWAAVSGLALLTHYFAAFLVVPEGLLLVAAARRFAPEGFRPAFFALGSVVAVGIALVPLASRQAGAGGADWVGAMPIRERILDVPVKLLGGPSDAFGGWIFPVVLVAWIAGFVWLARRGLRIARWLLRRRDAGREGEVQPRWLDARDPRAATRLAIVLGGVAMATPLALAAIGADYFYWRYLLAGWIPLAAGLVAVATRRLRPRRVSIGAAVVLVASAGGVASLVLDRNRHRDDWRTLARELGPPRAARALVLVPPWSTEPLRVYGQGLIGMPPSGYRVTEVAVIKVGRFEPIPPRTPTGFALPEVRKVQHFTLIRYRAPRPLPVDPAALAESVAQPPGAVSLQLPGPVPRPPVS